MKTKEAAQDYTGAGLHVIPIKGDGSKAPPLQEWKEYQDRLPSQEELDRWFDGRQDRGVAILGGNGLEILDFDRPGIFGEFKAAVEEQSPGLVARLPHVQTPRGGDHLYCRSELAGPNQKLARDEAGETLIETRGAGGYVVAPPSPPCCHPANKPYVHVGGPQLTDIPLITAADRDILFSVAKSFSRFAKKVVAGPRPRKGDRNRPGDIFNEKATWEEVLEPAGWTVVRRNGSVLYWQRPGTDRPGHSATTGFCDDHFYCFSTNGDPFEPDTAYTKFAAYALLNHEGDFATAARELAKKGFGEIRPESRPTEPVNSDTPNEAPDDPHRLARLFVQEQCSHPDGLTLHYWRHEWHRWTGKAYQAVPEKEVRANLCDAAKTEFDRVNLRELKDYERRRNEGKLRRNEEVPTARKVTQTLVGNVMQALTGLTVLPADFEQPGWVGDDGPFSADEVLAAANGLVHLPSLEFRPPTPRFFSPNVLDYAFDRAAPESRAWLDFLNELWPGDPESIQTVQEWFGYCLLPDTRLQKMLLLVGPKRSGKGTIARVLKALVGENNVAGPTLSSLTTSFGLWPLLTRTVAIVSDARLSGRADSTVITERLLSISGEDTLTVDRKLLPAVHVKLPTRFMILTNELPRVNDSSGALPGRMLVLRLTKSFFGREDPALTARLLDELPGILLWAIKGWRQLHERRHFLQPDSGRELLGDLEDLGSPVGAFVKECCVVGADHQVPKSELYQRWTQWCALGGREHPGDAATFGRNLLAAVSTVRSTQPRGDGKRTPTYAGIGLAGVAALPIQGTHGRER